MSCNIGVLHSPVVKDKLKPVELSTSSCSSSKGLRLRNVPTPVNCNPKAFFLELEYRAEETGNGGTKMVAVDGSVLCVKSQHGVAWSGLEQKSPGTCSAVTRIELGIMAR